MPVEHRSSEIKALQNRDPYHSADVEVEKGLALLCSDAQGCMYTTW